MKKLKTQFKWAILLLLLTAGLTTSSFAQSGLGIHAIGNSQLETAHDMIQLPNGNLLILGCALSYVDVGGGLFEAQTDLQLVEFNPNGGVVVFRRQYGLPTHGEYHGYIQPLAATGGNVPGYYLVSISNPAVKSDNPTYTNAPHPDNRDMVIMTLDDDYALVTAPTFTIPNPINGYYGNYLNDTISANAGSMENPQGTVLDHNGDLVVLINSSTGGSLGFGNGDHSFIRVEPTALGCSGRTDYISHTIDNGSTVGTRAETSLDFVRDQRFAQERFTAAGFYATAGVPLSQDPLITFYDEDLLPLSVPSVHLTTTGNFKEVIDAIVETNLPPAFTDLGYAITGTQEDDINGDIYFQLLDENGFPSQLGTLFAGGNAIDDAVDMIRTSDGGYAILGHSKGFRPGGTVHRDLLLIRLDSDGNLLWSHGYGRIANENASKIIERTDEPGFYLLGYTQLDQTINHEDILLIVTDGLGWANSGQDETLCEYEVSLTPTPITFTAIPDMLLAESRCGWEAGTVIQTNIDVPVVELCVDCEADNDPNFTEYSADVTLTNDQYWDGKYYFEDGVIVTVPAGITLDLTNVDIIFEECAGFLFEEGSFLRANNSVFRQCAPDSSWLGFRFDGTANAEINECTFKNAHTALWFNGTTSGGGSSIATVNLTNNLFSNNYIAIQADDINFTQAISGNTFVIDDQVVGIDWSEQLTEGCITFAPITGLLDNYWAIRTNNANFSFNVSQNDFTFNGTSNSAARFFGIDLLGGSANISANNFTDMFRGINVSVGASNVNIENNEMETTLGYDDFVNQIQISGSNNVHISGNQITNSFDYEGSFSFNRSGIYLDNVGTVNVNANEIGGFQIGVLIIASSDVLVGENLIRNANSVGVFSFLSNTVDISCNMIDMDYDHPNTNGVFHYQTTQGDASIVIRNNCVTEADHAITCSGPNSNGFYVFPTITNNHLANYQQSGIRNINMTGSVGSSYSADLSGRNSFYSNNIPNGAFDINSNKPMVCYGNFGISTVSSGVQVFGLNMYSSSASCGTQTGITANTAQPSDQCDGFSDIYSGLLSGANNNMLVVGNAEAILRDLPADVQSRLALSVMTKLHYEGSTNEAEGFSNLIGSILDEDAYSWFLFYELKTKGDVLDAYNQLLTITTGTDDSDELLVIEKLKLEMEMGIYGQHEWSLEDRTELFEIYARKGTNANNAIELLNHYSADYQYYYKALPTSPEMDGEVVFSLEDNQLQAYPNPTSGSLEVITSFGNTEGAVLSLFDIEGRLVATWDASFNFSKMTISLDEFQAGIYLLVLENGEGQKAFSKITKK